MSTIPRKVFIQVDSTEEQVFGKLHTFFVGYNFVYSYSVCRTFEQRILSFHISILTQENIKNVRKTLKVLQKGSTDKENLVGRPISEKNLFKKSKS